MELKAIWEDFMPDNENEKAYVALVGEKDRTILILTGGFRLCIDDLKKLCRGFSRKTEIREEMDGDISKALSLVRRDSAWEKRYTEHFWVVAIIPKMLSAKDLFRLYERFEKRARTRFLEWKTPEEIEEEISMLM